MPRASPPRRAGSGSASRCSARCGPRAAALVTAGGWPLVVELGHLLRRRGQAARALTLTLRFAGGPSWEESRRLPEASAHEKDLRITGCRGRRTAWACRCRVAWWSHALLGVRSELRGVRGAGRLRRCGPPGRGGRMGRAAGMGSPNVSEDAPAFRPGRNRTPAEQGRKRGFAPGAKDRPHDRVRCACACVARTKTARAPPSFAVQNRAGFNPAGVDRVRAAGR
ncbi:DinB/UmuC family translesion DNA polymerase [Streptomyces sp. NPDC001156]